MHKALMFWRITDVQSELRYYVRVETKTGHFRDVLPNYSLSMVLKKLNLIQQKQTCINKFQTTMKQINQSRISLPCMMSGLQTDLAFLTALGLATDT